MNVEQDIHQDVIRTRTHPRYAPDSSRESSEEWRESALCAQVDPELFHPEEKGASIAAARKICRSCSVTAQCLEAHIGEQYGVFGNTSAKERQELRKRRSRLNAQGSIPPSSAA